MDSTLRGQLSSSLEADGAVVGLIALAIVVVSSGQENAAAVASSAVFVPNKMDIKETLILLGLASAIKEHGAAILRLLGLILGKSRVTILKVDEGYVVARCGFQHRELRVLIQLVLVQHLITRVGTLTRERQKPLRNTILEEWVSRIASNPATSIALSSNHGAIRGNFVGTLNPRVSIGDSG
jgi:hypothetical protein